MSRIAKWKLEKTKVKVVFRLQFHATHIPQSGWDKLFISFIPADSGKATAKTTKANVRNGTCKWADPIYETTRLLQDTRTKQYDEKLYKFIVAMGSSRSSVLGEAMINLADYADALKPSAIALSLQGCDSGTILHVTAQLLSSKTGFREFEQQRELRESGLQEITDQHSLDESAGGKVNTKVRFKPESKELPELEEEVELNEDYADPAAGFDGSSYTSDSLNAEKHDTSSANEIGSLKSKTSGDLSRLSLSQSPHPDKGDSSDNGFRAQGTSDWVRGWGSDYSADNDLAIAYEENNRLRGSLEVAQSSILELKLEVNSLQNHTNELGAETQKFCQKFFAEMTSGEELAKEISVLKSECSMLKDDLGRLKNSKSSPLLTSRGSTATDQNYLFQNLQLIWLKGLLLMEGKIKELQNRACLGFQEMDDLKFLHPDLEALLGVLQDLKQETGQPIPRLNLVPSEKVSREMSLHESEQFVDGTGLGADLCLPEGMLHCLSIPGLTSREPDSEDDTNTTKGKIFELLRELDGTKAERESLAKKMEQMECYYEALIKELEESQRQILGELQNLRNEHSTCLYTISSTKAEMETMCQDMNKHILRFAEDKRDYDFLNKELERRAAKAETALKRARLNYSIAVEHLQKDLELLSFQVLSMFRTNENLTRQAFANSLQPSFIKNPDMAKNQRLDPEEFDAAKFLQFQSHPAGVMKQQLGGDILLVDMKRLLHLQQGLYPQVEEEVCEMHLANIYLDVFSKTLQETLLEASDDMRFMKEKMEKLTRQLELSNESKELLMLRLKTAMDDIRSLNEYNTTCIAKFNDMALHNKNLEVNLQNVIHGNHLLMQKIVEWEALMIEYRSYKSKYEICESEKSRLTNLLTKETLESDNLRIENFSLQEELKTVRIDVGRLTSVNSSITDLEIQLSEMLEFAIASEVRFVFTRTQYGAWTERLVQQLHSADTQIEALQKKHIDVETLLNQYRASEVHYIEENARLVTNLNCLRSEFDASIAQNSILLDTKDFVLAELEEYKNRADNIKILYTKENATLVMCLDSLRSEFEALVTQSRILQDTNSFILADLEEYKNMAQNKEVRFFEDKGQHAPDVERLKHMLASLGEEIANLMFSNEELEVKVMILKTKLDEQAAQITLLQGYSDELMIVQNKCNELTQKLSEQILKTEDFKNLSVYLKELKDKANAECSQAHEKGETEGPPVVAQESLRIAFIKEQYETRLQELKQQLSISKKDSQEMLWKLQDALDEIESRKKSEASHLKKNGQLGMKILELEVELQSEISDKRGKMAAELECSLISLECCKEEKQKLEASLQECNEEKSKVAVELTLMKELPENFMFPINNQKEGDDGSHKVDCMSDGPVIRNKMISKIQL